MIEDDYDAQITSSDLAIRESASKTDDPMLKISNLNYDEWAASGFPMGTYLALPERMAFLERWAKLEKRSTNPADADTLKQIRLLHKLHVDLLKSLHARETRR